MNPAFWIAVGSLAVAISIQGVAFAYFLGRLSQRVEALAEAAPEGRSVAEKVIRLEVEMGHANKSLENIGRELAGIQRQLANLATNGPITTGPHT